ncbi:MAG TPA: phosphate ABC transporter substrate-binding protein PstS [Mycobacteriales bacterium]|nr:phosphate ABC transporter substrate-binding protein PstS [Mycobacteriales bacterium]
MTVARLTRRVLAATAVVAVLLPAAPVTAQEYRAVTGSGSTWSANMVEQWTADVKQFGISVSYSSVGSSTGRREFKAGTVDFAVTEIPYGLTDAQGGYDAPPERGFAYLPIVAGGTSFMYNLKVAGKQVTNLRLSGENVTKIFTGAITSWNDAAIARDNPGIALPARKIVPVVRSDGSGTTAQFTEWMAKTQTPLWNAFCQRQRIPFSGSCPFTSNYPSVPGFVSQSGSLGVSGYVATPTAEGAITYVEYSYALRAKFPVAKLLNASGYYVEPTDQATAVGLLSARINTNKADRNKYLTQILDDVYRSRDARAYPLSSYSYMVIPTAEGGTFKKDKGRALGDFLYYSICEGQQAASVLGYSPLPQNLVKAGLDQIRLIPGVDVQNVQLNKCNNPTFSPDGTNTLAKTAPQPPACDKVGPVQCETGTGGVRNVATPNSKTPAGAKAVTGGAAAGGGTGRGTAGGTTGGASAGSGAATPGATTGVGGDPLAGAVVDPETGEVLAAGDGTTSFVSGVAVSAPGGTGTSMQGWFMALAALAMVVTTVGPALLRARLSRDDAS